MTELKMYENMLFDYGTTHRTDYRHGQLSDPVVTSRKLKSSKPRTDPLPVKGVHTLCDWRDKKSPPFSLFHTAKPIVRTNPMHVQKPFVKPIDSDLQEVIRTRPRVTLVPAGCLDDAGDPRARAIICEDMYTTQTKKVMREAVAALPSLNVRAPLPPLTTAYNPLTIRKLQPPVVPPEWRKDSVGWDSKQLRTFFDKDKHFWLRQKPPRCQPCEDFATIVAHRKMQQQMASKASYREK